MTTPPRRHKTLAAREAQLAYWMLLPTFIYDRSMALIKHQRDAAWDAGTLYQSSPFCVQDTFTNAVLHRADEDLLSLAELIGKPTEEIKGWRERTRRAFDTRLWDEDAGLYFDFDLRSSQPVRENTCATFAPLYAGLSDDAQAARLLEHLLDADEYRIRAGRAHALLFTLSG